MIILFLLVGNVLSAPTDEFGQFSRDGINESLQTYDPFTRNIVPGITEQKQKYSPDNVDSLKLPHFRRVSEKSKYVQNLNSFISKGVTFKGLIFTIYNDDMREAAIALFRLIQILDDKDYEKLKEWCENHLNKEMYMYALRLNSLFGPKSDLLAPPFIWNPHYFVNAETITKALMVVINTQREKIEPQVPKVDQYEFAYHKTIEHVNINTNYSGWNLPINGIEGNLNYFREDISLNSYYLGVHLLHPFWMSNEELDNYNPKHTEHYYYAHQQLMARYLLEKEHLKYSNYSGQNPNTDEADYVPYLMHKNGLPFPTRSCVRRNWDDEQAVLKTIDIALKECIKRGLLMMENGTTLNMTEDNHIDIVARLIRGNLDNVKTAKIIRSVFGYGGTKVPIDEYNPAPSLLHFPETSLRDPIYWYLIQYVLNYFTLYIDKMKPYDLSKYETTDIFIAEGNFSKIMTYFDYYKFFINYASTYRIKGSVEWQEFVNARQRRLKHANFSLNFTVESVYDVNVIVRIYLGPLCGDNCWEQHSRFFELDTFKYELSEGVNVISWSPQTSSSYSSDNFFDTEILRRMADKSYTIFKFPERLAIPRGIEQGLNLTLFIMITNSDNETKAVPSNYYGNIVTELDTKPIGFPFHRKATGVNKEATNYKFFNITIYHKKMPVDSIGYFSPHLY